MTINSNWAKVSRVPSTHLKEITFGNLKGKSDINPQWRIKAMTSVYGMCGDGWEHKTKDRWTQALPDGQVMCFVEVAVKTYNGEFDEWSKEVVGIGGDFLIKKNKNGIVGNDEGWAMAYTDGLGKALKSLGVASDVYEGMFDTKSNQYMTEGDQLQCISAGMLIDIKEIITNEFQIKLERRYGDLQNIPADKFKSVIDAIKAFNKKQEAKNV